MEYQDGTVDPNLGPMAEEKKRWLEKVMEETFVDLAKRMRGLLDRLDVDKGEDEAAEEEGQEEEVWEELQEHVENMDYALVFCQIGGLPTLFKALQQQQQGQGHDQDKALPALSVLAALTQNNPRVQAEVLGYCAQPSVGIDLLALLCGLVEGPGSSARLRAKALHALSCTVRSPGPTALEARFVSDFALPLFRAALSDPSSDGGDARVQGKALFFLQALLGADHADKGRGEALGLPLLPLVVPALQRPEDDVGVRHAAATVVSALANLLGGAEALLSSPAGPALREAMAARRAAIAALAEGSVEWEEAEEEGAFWDALEAGGTLLRDGETEASVAAAAAAVAAAEAAAAAAAGQGQEEAAEAAEEAAPVLLLEPPKLSGASQAP